MKISQKVLTEAYPEQYADFLRYVYSITTPERMVDLRRFYMLEYNSRGHDNPFPLIYPVSIDIAGVLAISFFELPQERIPSVYDYILDLKKFTEEEIRAFSPYLRIYKENQMAKIEYLPEENVIEVCALYFRMINRLAELI